MSIPCPVLFPDFLRWLAENLERDAAPRTSSESDFAGPWRILRPPGGDHGLFRRGESPDRDDQPTAIAPSREDALLLAAILPGIGRDPLYRLRTEPDPQGFAIEADGDVIGHLALFNPDVTAALHVVACLTRSPDSFARLFEAASGTTLAHAEKILRERAGTTEES
jgi:hypothetical protein